MKNTAATAPLPAAITGHSTSHNPFFHSLSFLSHFHYLNFLQFLNSLFHLFDLSLSFSPAFSLVSSSAPRSPSIPRRLASAPDREPSSGSPRSTVSEILFLSRNVTVLSLSLSSRRFFSADAAASSDLLLQPLDLVLLRRVLALQRLDLRYGAVRGLHQKNVASDMTLKRGRNEWWSEGF
ncbi:hypothetical protein HKD37_08G023573 [Glycine soja]